MAEDIDVLAARANQVTTDSGFINCHVESYRDRLLAFEFTNTIDAHRFHLGQSPGKAMIPIIRRLSWLNNLK